MATNSSSAKKRIRKTAPSPDEGKSKHERQANSRLQGVLPQVMLPVSVKRVLNKLIPSYFIRSWREVRKVSWPNRKETWRLTLAVFIFAVIFGALAFGVDKGLDILFRDLVLE
ncbi:MAG: preprotein translocase subunit SecE [Candidatus Saccharimonadales bacterium]